MTMIGEFRDTDPVQWIGLSSNAKRVAELRAFLKDHGTFEFPRLSNGLFPAASGIGSEFDATGYRNIWIRDNVHVAYAHLRIGDIEAAAKCVGTLATYLAKHRHRFENVILGTADPSDPMNRPHIRFRGDDLTELPETWAHAQNDALGYFLWIYLLIGQSRTPHLQIHWELVALLIHYFEKIEYWKDEDSGHWEETRKVSASSIGTVTEALNQVRNAIHQELSEGVEALRSSKYPVTFEQLEALHRRGESTLLQILPHECNSDQEHQHRKHDAALIFLCYPLGTLPRKECDQVLASVEQHLTGPIGVRRYLGDSYWCANYKSLFAPDQRSVDFSSDVSVRDRLMKPGSEAQWCIFDPAISCVYGSRYSKDHYKGRGLVESTLQKQVHHLQRSLAQLTKPSHPSGPYRCPESYYLEGDAWVPNDLTPLLWTQANLMQAIYWMEQSFKLREEAQKSRSDAI